MNYQNLWGQDNPGMFLILLDQSLSMAELYTDTLGKQMVAAQIVNRTIEGIVNLCVKGEGISDRCFIGVIGYGAVVELILGDMVSEIAENPKVIEKNQKYLDDEIIEIESPIWIKPRAENGTPMTEAFELAFQKARDWIIDHPDCFPPVMINISDGYPSNTESAKQVAEELMNLSTSDGNVLLMNVYIHPSSTDAIILPIELSFDDEGAQFLFEISSVIPDNLIYRAERVGLPTKSGSRLFVYKADAGILFSLLKFASTMGFL